MKKHVRITRSSNRKERKKEKIHKTGSKQEIRENIEMKRNGRRRKME